jgi:hypothetical protein
MGSQRWLISSVVVASMVAMLSAQTPKPTFEIASIRKNVSGAPDLAADRRDGSTGSPGGVLNVTNTIPRPRTGSAIHPPTPEEREG